MCNLHIRDHKHQTLRGRESRTENSTNQSSVESSHGSSLRLESRTARTSYLHLNYLDLLAENIFASLDTPSIAMLSHGGGGCNRENNGSLSDVISRSGGCLVSIASNANGHRTSSNRSGSSNSVKGMSLRDSRSCRSQQILQHLRSELRLWKEEQAFAFSPEGVPRFGRFIGVL